MPIPIVGISSAASACPIVTKPTSFSVIGRPPVLCRRFPRPRPTWRARPRAVAGVRVVLGRGAHGGNRLFPPWERGGAGWGGGGGGGGWGGGVVGGAAAGPPHGSEAEPSDDHANHQA